MPDQTPAAVNPPGWHGTPAGTVDALRAVLPHLPLGLAGYVLDSAIGEVVRAPRDGEPDDGDPRGYPVVMSWFEDDEGVRPEPLVLDAICLAVNAVPVLLAAYVERDLLRGERDQLRAAVVDRTKADALALGNAEDERDRARDAAAALEAKNAELRRALERIGAESGPTVTGDELMDTGESPSRPARLTNAQVIARAVLARTDPLRADM